MQKLGKRTRSMFWKVLIPHPACFILGIAFALGYFLYLIAISDNREFVEPDYQSKTTQKAVNWSPLFIFLGYLFGVYKEIYDFIH